MYNSRRSFTIGGVDADLYSKNGTLFIKLPPGSPVAQKIYFNFPFNNRNHEVYIKKLSFGPNEIEDPKVEKLENGKVYDFDQFISHCKLIIRQAQGY